DGQAGSSAQAAATSSPPVDARAGAGPDAAALDSEWEAYSDRSTCADWAGGDGVAAIRLSSSQLAWFFSDTDLGPAGPQAGFSRSSSSAAPTARACGAVPGLTRSLSRLLPRWAVRRSGRSSPVSHFFFPQH